MPNYCSVPQIVQFPNIARYRQALFGLSPVSIGGHPCNHISEPNGRTYVVGSVPVLTILGKFSIYGHVRGMIKFVLREEQYVHE